MKLTIAQLDMLSTLTVQSETTRHGWVPVSLIRKRERRLTGANRKVSEQCTRRRLAILVRDRLVERRNVNRRVYYRITLAGEEAYNEHFGKSVSMARQARMARRTTIR